MVKNPKLRTGPNGGRYYIKNGRKVYVSKNSKKSKSKTRKSQSRRRRTSIKRKQTIRSSSMARCRKSAKYERCVRAVKQRSPGYNPWAVCTKSVCGKYMQRT